MSELDLALERLRDLRDRRECLVHELDRVSRVDLDSDPPVRYSEHARRTARRRLGDVIVGCWNTIAYAAELGATQEELVEASGLLANDVAREMTRAAD